MKQNDIVLLVVAVFIGIIVSVLASKYFFTTPKKLSQQVDVVPTISTAFNTPSSKYFNSQAIDPTTVISIGQSNNPSAL